MQTLSDCFGAPKRWSLSYPNVATQLPKVTPIVFLVPSNRLAFDVLERSISATLRSTITARENLFFTLQSAKNDSTRMVELVDSTSETVAEAAKKAKQEMNGAIRTSLHHLAESIKNILRALPPSFLNEQRQLTIIDAAHYRMEIVAENAGQRVDQALHSYRGRLLKVDKDSGALIVDGPSKQQATDVLKNVIQASQTQIEGAVVAVTSFILTRIRSYLPANSLSLSMLLYSLRQPHHPQRHSILPQVTNSPLLIA